MVASHEKPSRLDRTQFRLDRAQFRRADRSHRRRRWLLVIVFVLLLVAVGLPFVIPNREPAGPGLFASWSIYVYNIRTASLTKLASSHPIGKDAEETWLGDVALGDLAWSPDGSKISFGCGGVICVVDQDGSHWTELSNMPGDSGYPSWSPDGKQILFANGKTGYLQVGDRDLYVMNRDGTALRWLPGNTLASDLEPAWSPDGSRIADAVAKPYGSNTGIKILDSKGYELTWLVSDLDDPGYPAWSPDGTWIAFSTDHIYLVHPDGSDRTRLAKGEHPTWSPDGRTIAFQCGDRICVMNRNGKNVRKVPRVEGARGPTWSPDGTRIAFAVWQG